MSYRVYLCHGPRCCARGGPGFVPRLNALLRAQNLAATVEVHASGCQDHCDYGPNLLVHPGGFRYVGLTAERLEQIVAQHLVGGEPVTAWLATPTMRRA